MRADHVAGAAFIALGIVVIAGSGELPFGSLAAPGAGMLPKVAAALMILFGALLAASAGGSAPLASIDWRDRNHAALLVLITGLAIVAYRPLGFLITMALLVFSLLVVVERRNVLVAAAYSVGLTLFAYWLFGKALRSPLERGLLWF
ncbi:MAG TPA: tripartite tricarboxylate transporter TctB family protein [Burkholderiales bacterium]